MLKVFVQDARNRLFAVEGFASRLRLRFCARMVAGVIAI